MLRVVELFAGIGGFRVGLEHADPDFFRFVWANQWEPGAKRQYAHEIYESLVKSFLLILKKCGL